MPVQRCNCESSHCDHPAHPHQYDHWSRCETVVYGNIKMLDIGPVCGACYLSMLGTGADPEWFTLTTNNLVNA